VTATRRNSDGFAAHGRVNTRSRSAARGPVRGASATLPKGPAGAGKNNTVAEAGCSTLGRYATEVCMAQRPVWEGHLRLSLVTCPVALHKAVGEPP
jgi:hypothetical protein